MNLGVTGVFAILRFTGAPLCGLKRLSTEECGACDDALPHRTGRNITARQSVEPSANLGARNHEDGKNISYESLYRHIDSDKHKGRTLYLNLWQRGKKRNKRGAATAGWGLIPCRIDIVHRPAIIDAK